MLDVNLQLFAEGEGEDMQQETQEPKTYSEDEVKDMLQKETDRRVSDAIKKREEKLREEMQQKIEQEKKDAESLAKLTADEREKELLERTKKEIEQREQELKRKELLSDTKDYLYNENIPVVFADLLARENAEQTQSNIKAFKDEWQKAIDRAVNEKLKGKTPSKGTGTSEEFNPFKKETLNLTKQGELMKNNPNEAERLRALANN